MHGYQLRAAFEESTGGTWPLNIGQVYTTLSRLERDGLVAAAEQDGQATYRITDAGRRTVTDWPTAEETSTSQSVAPQRRAASRQRRATSSMEERVSGSVVRIQSDRVLQER